MEETDDMMEELDAHGAQLDAQTAKMAEINRQLRELIAIRRKFIEANASRWTDESRAKALAALDEAEAAFDDVGDLID